MTQADLHKERQILMAMRKTLARIIRDLTPHAAVSQYPLSDATVEDVKKCFDLIAARERELAQRAGVDTQERPYFTDEVHNISLVSVTTLQSKQ
jgi:hypothetical protein